jgi:ComF family protein
MRAFFARCGGGPSLRAALAALGEAVYPPVCWLCRARACVDGFGCDEHALASARFDPNEPRCEGCAERLPAGLRAGPCARCRRRGRGYRRLIAFGPYVPGGALAEWILAFKHGGRRELSVPLAAAFARVIRGLGAVEPGALLVAVPLHPLRRLERGHDQARALAHALSAELDVSLVPALRRRRWTAPQGAPGARSRAANVAEAFTIRDRRARAVAGRDLWLVDDVVTSGATVRACAEELRRHGARSVGVLALARAERPEHRGCLAPGDG